MGFLYLLRPYHRQGYCFLAATGRFDKAAAAREELDRLLNVAVKEYEDDFALKEQKEEAARAGERTLVP